MKKTILLFFVLFVYFCGNVPNTENELRNNVVMSATALLGIPYKKKGSKKRGYDCSSFVRHVMAENSIYVSRSSTTQITDGIKVSLKEVKPGDLLIFKGANKKSKKPGHTGIVYQIDEKGVIHFIHSASSSGVTINNLKENYYKSRFIQARDVISTKE